MKMNNAAFAAIKGAICIKKRSHRLLFGSSEGVDHLPIMQLNAQAPPVASHHHALPHISVVPYNNHKISAITLVKTQNAQKHTHNNIK